MVRKFYNYTDCNYENKIETEIRTVLSWQNEEMVKVFEFENHGRTADPGGVTIHMKL